MSVQSFLDPRPSSSARSSSRMSAKGSQHSQQRICHGQAPTGSEPERPPPPVVGKVTHHNIELYWDEAMKKATENMTKADGRLQVCIQEEEKNGGWGNIYTGYSKKYVCNNLDPWTPYKYRIRFKNNNGYSEWSPAFTVSTIKEPMTGEHLHKAILVQNYNRCEQILESGELQCVDVCDKYGFTPLMQAAQKGLADNTDNFIDLLIAKGADVDFKNDAGKTALMLAAYNGHTEAVKELVHFGAKFCCQDKGGSTAFHWAMDGKKLETIDWMIDNGADVECTDFNGWTPLLRVAAVGGSRDVAHLLIRSGADVNKQDKDKKTTLMIAVVNNHAQLVELLLESKADLSVCNEYGKTAYEMAIACERRGILKKMEAHMDKNGIKYHH